MEDLASLAAHRRSIERLIPLLDAIRSVAEMAWRRADQALVPLSAYEGRLGTLLREVIASLEPDDRHRLLAGGASPGPDGLLLITSERGLCGGFNHRLVDDAVRLARERLAHGHEIRILCLGRRGLQLLESMHEPVLRGWPLPSLGVPTYPDIEQIALELLELVEQGRIGRLIAFHNAPAGRFEYGQQQVVLLPPRVDVDEPLPSSTDTWRGRMRIKPSGETRDLVTHLLTEHLLMGLYRVIAESVVSEQLARIQAMRLAVENARTVLEQLTLEYTVASRQAMTSALLEITTGYQLAQHDRRR